MTVEISQLCITINMTEMIKNALKLTDNTQV